jgi:transcriptional regulator with GAF, ATPase, and Fis domain
MTESLDLTRDLRDLVDLAADRSSLDDVLRRGLDALARIVKYDLGVVFVLDHGKLISRVARGALADSRVKDFTLDLSKFPSIREALDSRRARAFLETDHAHGEGDPFDGLLDFPHGHSCMVVPLCAGENCFGVMTLDRNVCEAYPRETVDLVDVYGQILGLAIQNAQQREALSRLHSAESERARLMEHDLEGGSSGAIERTKTPAMRDVVRRARQVAETETPVLILGETGTGKERLAHAIHSWSRRGERPFVAINCAAIPAGLLESELFGHVKGAFTGAMKDRPGRFQMANGGTLLLDEVGELPIELQAKLLRVLQEGRFESVGSDRTVRVDVRILAATHVDLTRAIAEKRFREDLFYRLSVFPLSLPPLRERFTDLPELVEAILVEQQRRTGRRGMRVTSEGLAHLRRYHWPGNIRELANILERATIVATGRDLTPSVLDLPGGSTASASPATAAVPSMTEIELITIDEVQRRHIRGVLAATEGRVYGEKGAAKILGLKPSTLQSRMKRLGM